MKGHAISNGVDRAAGPASSLARFLTNRTSLIGVLALVAMTASPSAVSATIVIDETDDSCVPADPNVASCAAACEADPLGCATDIQEHLQSQDFIDRRQLYPTTQDPDPNPTTPMHGLFNTMYVNEQAKDAIDAGIANPFDPIELPAWSIVTKVNGNPNPDDEGATLETWETPMYKIPGYCPERAVSGDDAACVGGEWFWYLARCPEGEPDCPVSDQFHVFNYDPQYGGLPAYGKANAFCLECHGAVSEADWLWVLHFRRERARQAAEPLRADGKKPGRWGAGFCEDVTRLNRHVPQDVRYDPATLSPDEAQQMFDCYAWKAFVALNQPAANGLRGRPGYVPFATPGRNRVWETYAQIYEAFQPQDPNWTLDGKRWHRRQKLPQVCKEALAAADPSQFPRNAMAYQVLNESGQAYGNQFNTLTDTNGNRLRYNIRFNQTEWRYLKKHGYADTGDYDYQGPTGATVVFPDNRSRLGANGAIEIKSAWKELCTDEVECRKLDDPNRYYSRYAFIYDQAVSKSDGTKPESCRVAHVGLVGLHAMFKTFWQPQWIWATFEHVDNVPPAGETPASDDPPYTLFDPKCEISDPAMCVYQRPGVMESSGELTCCQNLQMIPNSNPAPETPLSMSIAETSLIPNQITRIDAIDQTAKDLDAIFQPLLAVAGSPFQHYQLINTQWAASGRLGADAPVPYGIVQQLCTKESAGPCFTLIPEGLRLRNTTMESFQASYCHPDDEDIENNPADCTPMGAVDDRSLASSAGCMNCHLPSGADTSFIWEDAIWERVPINQDN